jgi:hypothetical protein
MLLRAASAHQSTQGTHPSPPSTPPLAIPQPQLRPNDLPNHNLPPTLPRSTPAYTVKLCSCIAAGTHVVTCDKML